MTLSARALHSLKGLSACAAALLCCHLPDAKAADFFWDADAALDGSQNGSGEWSSSAGVLHWTSSAALSGSTQIPWVNDITSTARLGAAAGYSNPGVGGILTLGENITLNQLIVGSQAGAYSIAPGTGGYGLIFSGTAPALRHDSTESLTIQSGWQAADGLTKTGAGRVIFTAPAGSSTGAGALNIQQGTVQLAAANTLSAAMSVVLGDATTGGALDVNFDQTLAGLSFQGRNSAETSVVTIAQGATLTVNGPMITGIIDGTATGNTTLATMTGGGSLVVNNATGSFIVSSGAKGSGSTVDISTLNLSGLSSFTATVNRFDVGRSTNAAGAFQSGRPQATLTLAASNTITATTFVVGAGNQTTTNNIVNLGQQNILNVGNLVLGNARTGGTLQFASGLTSPTLTLRGAAGGSSRADVTLGDSRNTAGVGGTGGSSQPNGIMNLTGGTVDLRINTLTIAVGGTDSGVLYGRGLGTFSFGGEASVVDVNTLVIGKAASSSTVSTTTTDPFVSTIGTMNMSGGSLLVNTRFVLGLSIDNLTGNQQDSNGAFNLTGGSVVVGSVASPVDIELGDHDSNGGGTGSGVLNLTGGSLSVNGNIRHGQFERLIREPQWRQPRRCHPPADTEPAKRQPGQCRRNQWRRGVHKNW